MSKRSALVAVLLSFACTGLGQIYCQRLKRGITLFLLSLSFAPIVVALSHAPPSTPALLALIGAAVGILALYLYAIVDAWWLARRSAEAMDGPVVRWGAVYGLFLLVGFFYPVVSTVVIRSDVLAVYEIAGNSMAPTLVAHDRILVNKRAFRRATPARGDLIAFRAPGRPEQAWVKRVVGLPGDVVAIRGGRVHVNGRALPGPKPEAGGIVPDPVAEENDGRRYRVIPSTTAPDFPPTEVPAATCFVLGDHRDDSRDSRHFRCIPVRDVIGEAQYVLLPRGDWARFGSCRAGR